MLCISACMQICQCFAQFKEETMETKSKIECDDTAMYVNAINATAGFKSPLSLTPCLSLDNPLELRLFQIALGLPRSLRSIRPLCGLLIDWLFKGR